MSKVVLEGHILVPDADLATVTDALETHILLTQQEKGCLVFHVTQNAQNPNRFEVYEEFVNRESFERHQQRVRHSAWGTVSINVERHYQVTEVESGA
ncbi:antibiotic biosynthesis monooxygenase [Pontibacterium granulatum]|uniref:putative quinol monooxygenase n=1 Tax=Pontibacterium granulatum TaxID=2036029 RepID=UPI00249C9B91|nr:antibiotic biosynthesis monooxygenase [Pontibacterium granulatum]MDI3324061.1 antibiotic biosynthesis monooxygenase [Pontibacterium granulatum]